MIISFFCLVLRIFLFNKLDSENPRNGSSLELVLCRHILFADIFCLFETEKKVMLMLASDSELARY